MISDHQTSTLYLADVTQLEFTREVSLITDIVKHAGYKVEYLQWTEDYYCRDYMPLQVDKDDFVQFIFNPKSYFEKDEYEFISDPVRIQLENKLPLPRYSRIILDGGNVIKWNDKAIITSRVLDDNIYQFDNPSAIEKELQNILKCEVIIIPEYPNERTGHADGLVRFINGDKVFINSYSEEPENEWLTGFLGKLEEYHLEPVQLPCSAEAAQKDAIALIARISIQEIPAFGGHHTLYH